MDFVKCKKYQSIKNCCGEKTSMDGENENNEFRNKECTFPAQMNQIEDTYATVNIESLRFAKTERHENYLKTPQSWFTNRTHSIYKPSSEISYDIKNPISNECMEEEIFSSLQTGEDKDFRCPRCGKKMQEPRLLPCLHPICSPCVSELMGKPFNTYSTYSTQAEEQKCNIREICPLCNFQLPNANSAIPPPHYPLQHSLVMDAIRCRLVNRVLCDACADEVVALVQCSTCLRNFCRDCGMEHQQLVTMELRPSTHLVRPLWEATKVRRTALCQKHPTHALRFYCIACQQVTCKECMWSNQHRGHATENAAGAGKRVAVYLTALLQRAKALLSSLLTQYDRNAFVNGNLEETRESFVSNDYRYVKLLSYS